MTTQTAICPAQIRKMGLDILGKSLGPVGMVRFLQQFETGSGNYTKDRARYQMDRLGTRETRNTPIRGMGYQAYKRQGIPDGVVGVGPAHSSDEAG